MLRPLALAALTLTLAACGTSSSAPRDTVLEGDGDAQASLRQFPGVTVTESGDGLQVRLRGTTSFMGDQEPLYIVDGVQIEPGPRGTLAGLQQRDVTDIRVLKSAAETSSYGPRGANGVVIITTRAAVQ